MKKDLCIDGKTFRFSGDVIKNSLWGHKNWPWGKNRAVEVYQKTTGKNIVVVEEEITFKEYNCTCMNYKEYPVPGCLTVELI